MLTNWIPRRLATRLAGWFSRIEQPFVRDLSLSLWRYFAGPIDIGESATSTFSSMHDCFTRRLKTGARPIDSRPDILVSPCDAIVGASGAIRGTEVIQAKGSPYTIEELLDDPALIDIYRDGIFVTLRLTSTMYHRFHAPADGMVSGVTYISGDTWNVNPAALSRVPRLFCKNERAVIPFALDGGRQIVTLVPVAAILVASIRLHCLEEPLNLAYRGPNRLPCQASFLKGEEMGYFEHGSTIIVFATSDLALCDHLQNGQTIRMGEALLRFVHQGEPSVPAAPVTAANPAPRWTESP